LQTQALLKKIQSDKIPIARTMHTSDLEVAANLTAYGCGIGILPTNVAKGAPKPLTKLVKAPIFKDEICIAIRVENKRIAAIQYICDVIKKGF